jgi:hypothetical protein
VGLWLQNDRLDDARLGMRAGVTQFFQPRVENFDARFRALRLEVHGRGHDGGSAGQKTDTDH